MGFGASTPEQLDSLLEDGFLVGDTSSLAELFEAGAIVAIGGAGSEARGRAQIEELADELCGCGYSYINGPRRVLQSGDIALVVAEHGISAMRRGSDRMWRYSIALLTSQPRKRGSTMTDVKTDTPAVRCGAGEARWWLGQLAEIKTTAADTAGQLTIVEVTCPPGFEAPLHVHHREDEAFWILDGEATLYVGDQTIEARAGDYAFGPRDVPHRYTAGDAGCRMLFICTPGGFEGLVMEMSEPAHTRTTPPPGEPPDMDWVQQVANKHGCHLLV